MLTSENLIQVFIIESRENIKNLEQQLIRLEAEPENTALLQGIFRAFHTLKGNSGIVGMTRVEKVAHIVEEILTQIRDGKRNLNPEMVNFFLDSLDQLKTLLNSIEKTGSDSPPPDSEAQPKKKNLQAKISQKKSTAAGGKNKTVEPKTALDNSRPATAREERPTQVKAEKQITAIPASKKPKVESPPVVDSSTIKDTTIRVDVALLDKLMNMVGELVLSRNQIVQFTQQFDNAKFQAASQRLDLCASELQAGIMKTRMQPIHNVFNRFSRVVRDLSQSLNKNIELKLKGLETELDKSIIEGICDPLTHLVRNAIDHGIEDEDTRKKSGKPPKGTLILSAYYKGGQVYVEIIDDGAGINPEKIRKQAVEKGLMTTQQANALSEHDVINLIFRPGFSTASKITGISGRGIGMDVVKTDIEKIGGSVEIHSIPGKGSTVKFKIPLTLAIIPALIVSSGGQRFAIPQINLLELVKLEGEKINNIEHLGDAEVYRLRDNLLPTLRLNKILQLPSDYNENLESLSLLALCASEVRFCLIVDQILDTEEIVVKSLCKQIKNNIPFIGASIMGDGEVALILDIVRLAEINQIKLAQHHNKADELANSEIAKKTIQTFLLFSVHPKEQLAIPMQLVSRIETFNRNSMQRVGGREVIEYNGAILPLLRFEKDLPASSLNPDDSISVIIFTIDGKKVGLVVSKIIDIIDSDAEIDTVALQDSALFGSTLINSKVTLIIDIFNLIHREFPKWFERKNNVASHDQTSGVPNILIVDDSPFIRAIERSYIEPEGYRVFEANDGQEALNQINNHHIDLVITDVKMPNMDGLELIRNIRKNTDYPELPVVIVSNLNSPQEKAIGIEAGATVYLKKLNREELMASLKELIVDGLPTN